MAGDALLEAKLRWARLFEQLEGEPEADVLGVVGANGAGGGSVPGDATWTVSFELTAWRIEGAEIQTRPLRVHRRVPEPGLRQYMKELVPYTVVRMRARVLSESPFGGPAALLESFPVREHDPALDDWAAKLQEPVTFHDQVLGTFTLDRRVNWYTAAVRWRGRPIELQLTAATADELQGALAAAHTLWSQQETWSERIQEFAARKLLDIKNDNWADEDEDGDPLVISSSEFKARMALESIIARGDGTLEFWHEDGGLFLGHAIQVQADLHRGPIDADIVG